MNQMPVQITKAVAWLLPLTAMVGGCVSAERQQAAQDQLGRAQTAYRQAEADPNVQSFAQLPLLDAQKALEAAKQAKEVEDIQHLGYVAERKAQTASAIGRGGKLEQETQQLSKETSEILMQRRERELKAARAAARAEAEARAREAEQARQAAEARAREAEQAQAQIGQTRTELEAQARQVEQARQAAEARAREAEQARVQVELARMETEAKAREAEQARIQAATAQAQATAAQAQTAALSKELTDLKGKQTERGVVLTMGDVFFSIGKADITPGAQRSADKLAEFLKKYPSRNVLIEGHTDNTGREDANLTLSQKRADAVKDLLVAKGISPDRIGARGYGVKYPLVSNDTPSGRQQNRRVEVVVLDEGVSPEKVGR
jgi:outer membrane protein OmpA-like peptidoglycan-associated protein